MQDVVLGPNGWETDPCRLPRGGWACLKQALCMRGGGENEVGEAEAQLTKRLIGQLTHLSLSPSIKPRIATFAVSSGLRASTVPFATVILNWCGDSFLTHFYS